MTPGRRTVPLAAVAGMLAFVVAQAASALAPWYPQLWSAALALVVLGGITPLIYAVNLRVLPIFSRRAWQSPRLLSLTVILAVGGAWVTAAGRALLTPWLESAGSGVALLAGCLFMTSVIQLMRAPALGKFPPRVDPAQLRVEGIGQRFTRLAAVYLLVGLIAGFVTTIWTPRTGRWDLVWAHALLVGWFLTMASGVCYHVLPRWSHRRWRHPSLVAAHFWLVFVGLPAMLLALALDLNGLFLVAGPVQAAALVLFIWNIVPMLWDLPSLTRIPLLAASAFLVTGVSIGAGMAVDPAHLVVLHQAHAEINLFGWSALLITGFGYYLFPRFAGRRLPWPRLAMSQIALQIAGVSIVAVAWYLYASGHTGARLLILVGGLLSAAGLALFGAIVAATFRSVIAGRDSGKGRAPKPAAKVGVESR